MGLMTKKSTWNVHSGPLQVPVINGVRTPINGLINGKNWGYNPTSTYWGPHNSMYNWLGPTLAPIPMDPSLMSSFSLRNEAPLHRYLVPNLLSRPGGMLSGKRFFCPQDGLQDFGLPQIAWDTSFLEDPNKNNTPADTKTGSNFKQTLSFWRIQWLIVRLVTFVQSSLNGIFQAEGPQTLCTGDDLYHSLWT